CEYHELAWQVHTDYRVDVLVMPSKRSRFTELAAVAIKLAARTGAARGFLSQADVERIIAQTAAAATKLGLPVAIAVVDKEGPPLGLFQMEGARTTTTLWGGGKVGQGLEGVTLPDSINIAGL